MKELQCLNSWAKAVGLINFEGTTMLEFLCHGSWLDKLWRNIHALLIFDPLITLWDHFKAPYFKMLNDACMVSAGSYVRTCRRIRNRKKIATICDFHLCTCMNLTRKYPTLKYKWECGHYAALVWLGQYLSIISYLI